MLKWNLCDYSDVYILVKGTIPIAGRGADLAVRQADKRDKEVIFKSCAPFTDWISEINNTQVDKVKYVDVMRLVYNWMEYSNNYSKTFGINRLIREMS